MEYEPEIPSPRESETLLIVVDTHVTDDSESSTFPSLRDAAMRMARTRLVYSVLKDDLLSVIASGSTKTKNKLASENEGGYTGIEVLQPPATKNLNAVRVLSELKRGTVPSNLLNILDVCGDTLSEPAVTRSKKKRMVLFTDAVAISRSLIPADAADFEATCELYKEHEMQVDVICHCDERLVEKVQAFEAEMEETTELSVKDWMAKTEGCELSHLFSLCKASGGVLMSLSEASPLLDRPTPKVKRAMAKYRGTLNIADIIKIPVKRFSFVAQATHPTSKKLSWESSTKRKEPVPVLVETQRVASAKDDAPLEAEEIVNAYPYGPELVPEQNEVDAYAWSMHLPKGLDALGFVEQQTVPQRLFMGRVDVVIAMPGVDGADRLMKTLVLAMQAEQLGILARSVTAAKGGPPQLAYLWPRVEVDTATGALRNFFLFQVEIPMREDIRDLPFASLAEAVEEIPEDADNAMLRYISAAMLEEEVEGEDTADEEDEENEGEEEPLWPPEICNPNLDWFNICVVHRALAQISGSDFPPLTEWQQKIIDPTSFVREHKKDALDRAVHDLKSILPVIPAKKKEKKGKRVHQALNGDMASIVDYLPREMVENKEEDSEEEEENDANAFALMYQDPDAELSTVTDLDTEDVGDDTPVDDFEKLVNKDKFSFAAVSLLVVVRRLIRDLVDDDKAMSCLQALRRTSVEKKEPRFFNDFIISLISRCRREDALGNRTAAFFRHVARRNAIDSTVGVIAIARRSHGTPETAADQSYRDYLDGIARKISTIVQDKKPELSTSAITDA